MLGEGEGLTSATHLTQSTIDSVNWRREGRVSLSARARPEAHARRHFTGSAGVGVGIGTGVSGGTGRYGFGYAATDTLPSRS